ncbi:type IX secretion system periplasmic lipoprotein PorW/SprE [Planktosalinus lacus]|uniref:type IX secretion system periplasmic lipoprotein PorW/SprE n=1 Tax=Planktosalinus lacus TaxID=1526573 RepID=UPI004032C8CA
MFFLVASSCSRKKSTFMTRNFRAVNAEFNAIYNGNLALEQGKQALVQNVKDDYFEVLPVERIQLSEEIQLPGENRNTDFERAEEKAVIAIQKHSIYFNGKEHNPQIDEAYMLLGKARYYESRFIPAIEAFNFVLHRYPTSNSVNKAKIWREKTNIRLKNEDVALKNLKELFENAELEDEDFADASAMIGQAYINMEHPDSALVHIKNAAKSTKDNETKGRLLFIKGQLYNILNQKDSANIAFNEVIELNRKSPRIYFIHSKIQKIKNFDYEKGDKLAQKEQFEDLIEDRENRPYLDVIHHQKGEFYLNIGETDEAITAYNKSIKEFRQNQKLQALNYSSLGDIYFDNSEYKTAGSYYDSTLQRLVENTREHRLIKKKRDNLEDVIRYEDIVTRNDSIISIIKMDESERLAYFTEYTNNLKNKAISDSIAMVKEKETFRSNEFFKGNQRGEDGEKSSGNFYFYNSTAVASGKLQFRRQWGDRELEDDWRRSNKRTSQSDIQSDALIAKGKPISENEAFNAESYLAEIPSDQKVIDSIVGERNMAYYQLGLIYKEKFKEYNLAIDRLETLLTFQLEERLVVPSKYHLYKAYELLGNSSKVQQYKNDIVTNHPDSRYAEIISNPEAVLAEDESSPEFKYNQLYRLFEEQQYTEVIEQSDKYITQYIGDAIVPKFEMLKATAIGKQDGLEAYKKAINFISLNYPNTEEGKKANNIYNAQIPKLENFDFKANNDTDRWKLIYEFNSNTSEDAIAFREKLDEAIKELNFDYLDTSIDYYNTSKKFVVVHGLYSQEGAKGFAETLKENKKFKISNPYIEISSPNYAVVQVHKNLDLYNDKIN